MCDHILLLAVFALGNVGGLMQTLIEESLVK